MYKKISIVIPVFNEADNILKLYSRLNNVISCLSQFEWEYIFINDGSIDDSYKAIKNLANIDPKIVLLDFSRNFGKEIALTAGAHEAVDSDAIICIDADLQHPPELIPLLIERWVAGADVVVTIRSSTEKESILRKIGSFTFYWVMNKISGVNIKPKTTDFRLYDKKVVNAFSHITEHESMFRGIMDWLGFDRCYIHFQADVRASGKANYSYRKLFNLAINGITSFSLWPLKIAGYIGLLISGFSLGLLIWMLLNYFILRIWIYTPLAIVIVINTLLIGIVLMAIGLVALYVGKIHTEVANRPLYILREKSRYKK
jgi:polyisoprenyl-phosphate glycosyltransferase